MELKEKWLKSEEHKIYKFSEDEINWLVEYEESTGFEPMIDYTTLKSFKDIGISNLKWYEGHTQDIHRNLSLYINNLDD